MNLNKDLIKIKRRKVNKNKVQLFTLLILKILLMNPEHLLLYRFIFTNLIIVRKLKEITTTELYKWRFLVANFNCPALINGMMYSNNIEIVKKGIMLGSTNYNALLRSNNLDIVKLGIKLGANNYNLLLNSDNIDIIRYGVAQGFIKSKYLNLFNLCNENTLIKAVDFGFNMGAIVLSGNIKKIKICIKLGIINTESLLYTNNLKLVKLGIANGAKNINVLMYSNNIDIVKYGITMGATKFNRLLYSNNVYIVKLGVSNGANKYGRLLTSNNVDIFMYYFMNGINNR